MTTKAHDEIAAGLRDAIAFAEGDGDRGGFRVHVPAALDVKAIRRRLGLTQAEFAARFGFNVSRVRDWEQGRSHPDGAIRAYLVVIEREPDAVQRALETRAVDAA
jgi:putative transcriptional regulator